MARVPIISPNGFSNGAREFVIFHTWAEIRKKGGGNFILELAGGGPGYVGHEIPAASHTSFIQMIMAAPCLSLSWSKSVMATSVERIIPAIDPAFWSPTLTTLAGSITPCSIRFS